MPTFENFLHYRSIDVSTVKELGLWWHGVRYNKPSEGKHTALHDIQQSIEELRFLRGSIFR
jgi:oligoribonuclease